MPDGDRVHKGLAWKYQKVYKQLCDGQFGGGALAEEAVSAVWKDIQKDENDELLHLLQKVSEQCQQLLAQPWFALINWRQEHAQVDLQAQPICTDRRLKTLAVEACNDMLQDIRMGGHPSDCYIELLEKYTWNVYVAQFEEKVPLTSRHYREISREFARERLLSMRQPVQALLLQYIEKTYHKGTVQLIRTPRRRSSEKQRYTIHTDLFDVGA